jgi:hypothetical protein
MTAVDWLRAWAYRVIGLGLVACVLLLVWGVLLSPRLALAGWLAGLLFWLGIALGAYALLAVHALTSGLWLRSLYPVLAPAVASMPVFVLLAMPLYLGAATLWPWVTDPSLAKHASVARWYLNLPGFALRGVVAFAGWSLLGLLLVGSGARRPAVGAPALIFHAFALTAIALDWILSFDPHFRSTAFAAELGVTQVLAAMAWCAVLEPEPAGTRGKAGDLAMLMIAAALGAMYLGFAQYLVAWYGNLPDKAEWFLRRQELPWVVLNVASILLSAVLPVAALLPGLMRRSPRALAWIGAGTLAGVLLYVVWLVGEPFGPWILLSAALGTVAVGGVWAGLAGGPFAARLMHPTPEASHGA